MKKLAYLTTICLLAFNCIAQEPFTEFPQEALNDTFITLEDENIAFKQILEQHKGKTILIDVWASWCGDCIKGLPKVKALQEVHKDVVFLFLSADRSLERWKRGLKKYNIKGEHYFMPKGMKSVFSKTIGLNWIPRYMIIDPEGQIKLFKAIKADDSQLIKALN
ncbi:TlpA family protein disulfide reductase [Lacinutrix iliipiscaria]|uniref:TlpA family protein disulfide reductase n=1 Tax=Lacinutrix iliipiscaria TaxID=1230532 RepID=A0ABW5WMW4_9FLAO